MTQVAGSGAPSPVQGVTGGPGLPQGTASIEGSTGNVVVTPPSNTFQLRKGASPQALQIFEYFNSNTDNVRIELSNTAGGPAFIGIRTAPTVSRNLEIGSTGQIRFSPGGALQVTINAVGTLFPSQNGINLLGQATSAWLTVFAWNYNFGTGSPNLRGGTGVPNAADGVNGDFYFRLDGAALTTIYQKRAGVWTGIV